MSKSLTEIGQVFVLPLIGEWLLYAPLHGISALMNKSALKAVMSLKDDFISPEIKEIIHSINKTPDLLPGRKQGDFLPDFIGLIPTRDCNQDCRYCGFHCGTGPAEIMKVETITASIEWYARLLREKNQQIMNIHFFGGEPFLYPHEAAMAVQAGRIKAEEFGLEVRFEAATNGIMSEETAVLISDYIDFIMLSLDGPPDIQNKLRPLPGNKDSYDLVQRNARIFSHGQGDLCIRSCIISETVDRLPEIASWFIQKFHPVSISFETLQPGLVSKKMELFPPDPWKFALSFVEASALLEDSGVKPVYATADIGAFRTSFCPLGRDVAVISPDGSIAGCYLFEEDWMFRGMDLKLGQVFFSGDVTIDEGKKELLRDMNVLNKPRCRECFCRWHCAGGCHVNHSYPGCSDKYDDLCIQTRIICLYNILKNLGRKDVFDNLIQQKMHLKEIIMRDSDIYHKEDLESAAP